MRSVFFWEFPLGLLNPWGWEQHVVPKRRLQTTIICCVKSQNSTDLVAFFLRYNYIFYFEVSANTATSCYGKGCYTVLTSHINKFRSFWSAHFVCCGFDTLYSPMHRVVWQVHIVLALSVHIPLLVKCFIMSSRECHHMDYRRKCRKTFYLTSQTSTNQL